MSKLGLGFLLAAVVAWPQAADYANTRYKTTEGRQEVARGLTGPTRDARQRPKDLVAALKITTGMTVADIGTGVGYMLPYLAEAVGPSGKLIAEDIFPDFLDQARAHAKEKGVTNITFVQGDVKDPKLPAGAADLALVLDAYHHFDYPADVLAGLARGLKSGGRLAVVEYYKETFSDPNHIRETEQDLIREVKAAGLTLISSGAFTEKVQFLAIFRKN